MSDRGAEQARNEAAFRRLIEQGFSRGDTAAVDELFAEDFVEHQSGIEPPGREGVKAAIAPVRPAAATWSARGKAAIGGRTMPETTAGPVFRATGQAQAVWSMGSLHERVLTACESAGAIGLSVVTQPAGTATPLHVHHKEAEAFYLLEGSMTYRAGEGVFRLEAGDFIYLPVDIPHAFRITGASPARFLAFAVPGAVLDLYQEVGRPAQERRLPEAPPRPEEIAGWLQAAGRYGIEVLGPPLPEG